MEDAGMETRLNHAAQFSFDHSGKLAAAPGDFNMRAAGRNRLIDKHVDGFVVVRAFYRRSPMKMMA